MQVTRERCNDGARGYDILIAIRSKWSGLLSCRKLYIGCSVGLYTDVARPEAFLFLCFELMLVSMMQVEK